MLYKKERPAVLMLKNGKYFEGIGFGASKIVTGEIVFNTMTGAGYNETLTDPSYQGQIVTMTHPLVGNYGVPVWEKDKYGILKYFESDSIKVRDSEITDAFELAKDMRESDKKEVWKNFTER